MRKPLKSVADSLHRIIMSPSGGAPLSGDSPGTRGRRTPGRTSRSHATFELSSQPGLENRMMLAAEIPAEFAEVSTIHDAGEVAVVPIRQNAMIPLAMSQLGSREPVIYRLRSLDANFVRVTYGSFRQIQPGSDRFTTTVSDSLSVKYGSPLDSTFVGESESVTIGSAAGSVGMTEAQPPRHHAPGGFDSANSEPDSQPGRTGVTLPFSNRPMPPGPNPGGADPLIKAGLPPLLMATSPAGPNHAVSGPMHGAPGSPMSNTGTVGGISAGGAAGASFDLAPGVFDAPDSFGSSSPEMQFVQVTAPDLDVDSRPANLTGERTFAHWQEGRSANDLASTPESAENPTSPGIWTRISDAFDLDDSDFDPIGGDPLVEPAEIDADALSAAVDRIIAGFVNPVEDSLESVRFGPTLGLAAGAFIAFQVYSRRRRSQGDAVREDPSEEAEPVTHVVPELDPVDDRGR